MELIWRTRINDLGSSSFQGWDSSTWALEGEGVAPLSKVYDDGGRRAQRPAIV